jgi:hypothetical protein
VATGGRGTSTVDLKFLHARGKFESWIFGSKTEVGSEAYRCR